MQEMEALCGKGPMAFCPPRNLSIRERAIEKRDRLQAELSAVEKLIASMDLHPEVESVMTALIAAGI